MKKLLATMTVSGIALAAGSMAQAQEVHLIMCGGETCAASETWDDLYNLAAAVKGALENGANFAI